MPATTTRPEWTEVLKEFSRRNLGRGTRLELDDVELGAQWAELELRFRGAAYEPRFRRVEIMLAAGVPTDHLTHSVEAVTHVDVQAGVDGRDRALRVAYPGGQIVLVLGA